MQCVLNFSKQEKDSIKSFLKEFPEIETKSQYEDYRCKIRESTVTLYTSGKILIQGEDCNKVKEIVLDKAPKSQELILGIDETGRGEDFGPFVIAAVLGSADSLRELRDSKKVKNLKQKFELVEEKSVATGVAVVSSEELWEFHEKGVNMNQIEAKVINGFVTFFRDLEKDVRIIVDGNPLKDVSKEVEFLVKGDDLNPVVGAASVLAKATRDNSKDKGKRKDWGKWQKKNF